MKTESKIQQEIFLWFNNHSGLVSLRGCFFAVPNGELRDKRTAARLIGQGVVRGIPDMVLVYNKKVYFFEIKTPEGKLSKDQKRVIPLLEAQGAQIFVIRSIDQFKDIIQFITKTTLL